MPDTVTIPAGAFRMGCVTGHECKTWEKPVREARVGGFALSKHEVTFARSDVCMEYGPCRRAADAGWGRGDRPVINVGWDDVRTYVAWRQEETGDAYRPPGEAEWEYATRRHRDAVQRG